MTKYVYTAIEDCGCITSSCPVNNKLKGKWIQDFIKSGRFVKLVKWEDVITQPIRCQHQIQQLRMEI